ncbi:hypothetical protein SLS62_000877 [Diatrype stigma]|uniref:Uncharacterized protein n=1 Tax=Diatrype stigma TaxID=117547 RepID=A0AAN9V2N4_9PEZI
MVLLLMGDTSSSPSPSSSSFPFPPVVTALLVPLKKGVEIRPLLLLLLPAPPLPSWSLPASAIARILALRLPKLVALSFPSMSLSVTPPTKPLLSSGSGGSGFSSSNDREGLEKCDLNQVFTFPPPLGDFDAGSLSSS